MSASSYDGSEDQLEGFKDLLNVIKPDKLETIALQVRGELDVQCSIGKDPLYGYHNLVYPINFSDGIKWAARIPSYGT